MCFRNCRVLYTHSVFSFCWRTNMGRSTEEDVFILPCKPLLWAHKCWKPLFGRQMHFFLVQLEGTGCLLLPNLLEYEFSSPLFLSFVLIVCNFIEASCAASEKVSRKKNIYYPGWGQKWRFVNNKNAIFVFQIKHYWFFSNIKIYWLDIWCQTMN